MRALSGTSDVVLTEFEGICLLRPDGFLSGCLCDVTLYDMACVRTGAF